MRDADPVMKLVTTILFGSSLLCVFGEDAKLGNPVTTPPPVVTSPKELPPRLDWHIQPAYWETILPRPLPAEGPTAIERPFTITASSSTFDLKSVGGGAATVVSDAQIDRVLHAPQVSGLKLGSSDYTFESPILEGLLPRRTSPDASLGEKIMSLPVVRWFRPLPMPQPPGGGRYFKWGERDSAWPSFCQPVPGPRALDSGI